MDKLRFLLGIFAIIFAIILILIVDAKKYNDLKREGYGWLQIRFNYNYRPYIKQLILGIGLLLVGLIIILA